MTTCCFEVPVNYINGFHGYEVIAFDVPVTGIQLRLMQLVEWRCYGAKGVAEVVGTSHAHTNQRVSIRRLK